jgi:hypothetical protein
MHRKEGNTAEMMCIVYKTWDVKGHTVRQSGM